MAVKAKDQSKWSKTDYTVMCLWKEVKEDKASGAKAVTKMNIEELRAAWKIRKKRPDPVHPTDGLEADSSDEENDVENSSKSQDF